MGGTDFFTFVANLIPNFTTPSSFDPNPIRIMTLDIVLLIVRPFIRVIAYVIFFGYKRNFKYFLMTSFVLIVLTLSLIIHQY